MALLIRRLPTAAAPILGAALGLIPATGCSIEREQGLFPTQQAADAAPPTDDAGPDPIDDAGPPPRIGDPAGQWMLFVEDRNCLVGVGDPLESIIWSWYAVELIPSGEGRAALTVRSRICHQELSPLAFGFLSVVPDVICDNTPAVETGGFLVGDEAGALFLADTIFDYWGVEGIADTEDVPVDIDDPRIVDLDEDGNPGVTLPVTTANGGPICEVYVAQRVRVALEGRVVDGRTIVGDAASGTDKSILATSTELCASGDVVPNMAGNRFALVRIDGREGAPDVDADDDGEVQCPELRDEIEGLMAAYAIERSAPDGDTWCQE